MPIPKDYYNREDPGSTGSFSIGPTAIKKFRKNLPLVKAQYFGQGTLKTPETILKEQEEERNKKYSLQEQLDQEFSTRMGAPFKEGRAFDVPKPVVYNTPPLQPQTEEDINKDFEKYKMPGFPGKDLYPQKPEQFRMGLPNLHEPEKYKLDYDGAMEVMNKLYGKRQELPEKPEMEDVLKPEMGPPNVWNLMAGGARDLADIFSNHPMKGYTQQAAQQDLNERFTIYQDEKKDAEKIHERNQKKMENYIDLYKEVNSANKSRFSDFINLAQLGEKTHMDNENLRVNSDKNVMERYREGLNAFQQNVNANKNFNDAQKDAFNALSTNANKTLDRNQKIFSDMWKSKQPDKNGNLQSTRLIFDEVNKFHNSQIFKENEVMGNALNGFISASYDSAGDLTRIYHFIKGLDPRSAVREGEIKNAESLNAWLHSSEGQGFVNKYDAGPLLENIYNNLKGEGKLKQTVKDSMFNTILNSYQTSYSNLGSRYSELQDMFHYYNLDSGAFHMPIDQSKDWQKRMKVRENVARGIKNSKEKQEMEKYLR